MKVALGPVYKKKAKNLKISRVVSAKPKRSYSMRYKRAYKPRFARRYRRGARKYSSRRWY